MSQLFNMLSRFVTAYLQRNIISWMQPPSTVILDPKKMKSVSISILSLSICHEVMGLPWDCTCHDLSFLNVEFFFLIIYLVSVPCSMWDLSSLTRIEPMPWLWKHRVLTIGPPGKSRMLSFKPVCSLSSFILMKRLFFSSLSAIGLPW